MTQFVVAMDRAADDPTVGNKAGALARCRRAGFDVPDFFVIAPAAFTADGMRSEAEAEVRAALRGLAAESWAVRSSARDEDGVTRSHAGQLLTLLRVASDQVPAAAHRVWLSGFSDHLNAYRSTLAIAADATGPAVLVQCIVEARAAGVAFSADPLSARRDVAVVGATRGLADRLVGGDVAGDTYRVDRARRRIVERVVEDVPALSEEEVLRVAALAVAAEQWASFPQDIEWALDDERLWLIQSRPITTLGPKPDGDEDLVVFDNSNIVESYPGVVSPLTFSFARHVYAHVYRVLLTILGVPDGVLRANRTVFETMLGRVDGRVYYNLLNWYRTLALLPGFRLNRAYMETMMGVGEALPPAVADRLAPPPAKGVARVAELLRLARVAFRLAWYAIALPRTVRAFEARLAAVLDRPRPGEYGALASLVAEYRALEEALLERWDAPMINDLLCMIAFGASRRLLERWAGADGIALHNDVLIGQGDIVSAEPAKRIRVMGRMASGDQGLVDALARGDSAALDGHPALAREVDAYLAKFGDRCTEELKLESIPLTEDRAPLLRAIGAAALAGEEREVQRVEASARLGELFAGRPVRRMIAGRLLVWAKARVRDRENLRFERTRVFGRVRRIVRGLGDGLAVCGRIEDPRDVFLLTLDEVLGAIEGAGATEDLAGLAAVRRAEMLSFTLMPDPPSRLEKRGAAAARGVDRVADGEHGDERSGLGCSRGRVAGSARVVRDPRQDVVQRGEIMVARHTDPGWIALFANAAGIVTERGSLLSHSAIVAREMGIPCVVALKGALDWIATGDRIEIDGQRGTVRKLDA